MKEAKVFRSRQIRTRAVAVLASLVAVATFILHPVQPASALDGSQFNPGLIISDAIFFNGNAMSAAEVQNFLNSKVPTCTINNGQPSHAAGAPYGTTFIADRCLKDFAQPTPSMAAQAGICSAYPGSGMESAASIIAKVGQVCNVSQKVLLVLLQKEQSLISDTWPTVRQINQATGFACYDNGQPCVQDYAGFFYQVWSAARQLQRYGTAPFTWYPVGQTTNILFQANRPDCGSSPVFIQNRATAALYYYTPYQPNTAALNNLYGTGDSCSAYGNRNFWRLYNDWFGSTLELPGSREFVSALYADVLGRNPSANELNYWVGRMSGGYSRYDLASFFTNSDEFRNGKISEAYRVAFSRSPDSGGASFWLSQMQLGQIRPDDLLRIFLTTPEMYNQQGGGTNRGFVSALYQQILMRTPDAEGLNYWVNRLDQGDMSIYGVADSIWYSQERRTITVQNEFQKYLGRTTSGSDLEFWSAFTSRFGISGLRAALLFTDEYRNNAENRF